MALNRSGKDGIGSAILRQSTILPLEVDVVLFDMDGVLVNVADSYRRAIRETVKSFSGIEITPQRIQEYKNRGGFNDDWRLTEAVLREAGHDVSFEKIVEVFNHMYRGANWDGFIADEPPLISAATLVALKRSYHTALVTGRPEAEARWTLRRFDWEGFFPVVIPMEAQQGKGKPDPYPLALALDQIEKLGSPVSPQHVVYVGDSVDDIVAANKLGARSIGVVPPGIDPEVLGPALDYHGAAAVIRDVNVLPLLLKARERV